MKKVLVFGASNSRKSINKQLATYAASLLADVEAKVVDLNDYEMPLFGVDREREEGIPQLARDFLQLISDADGILISLAEHNGSYSVAYKNIFDWTSRLGKDVWQGKPLMLMATSPGGRGGASVLAAAVSDYPYRGGQVIASFSLPVFGQNFHPEQGIMDDALLADLKSKLAQFREAL